MYTDDSVTKDQSEDSAAYTVSISSLTTEVEEVTHALRWTASRGDSRTKSAIILTDSISLLQKMKSWIGSLDWNLSMVDIHLRKHPVGVLPCTCQSEGK